MEQERPDIPVERFGIHSTIPQNGVAPGNVPEHILTTEEKTDEGVATQDKKPSDPASLYNRSSRSIFSMALARFHTNS